MPKYLVFEGDGSEELTYVDEAVAHNHDAAIKKVATHDGQYTAVTAKSVKTRNVVTETTTRVTLKPV